MKCWNKSIVNIHSTIRETRSLGLRWVFKFTLPRWRLRVGTILKAPSDGQNLNGLQNVGKLPRETFRIVPTCEGSKTRLSSINTIRCFVPISVHFYTTLYCCWTDRFNFTLFFYKVSTVGMNISNILGITMENRILKSLMLSWTVSSGICKASRTVFIGSIKRNGRPSGLRLQTI